MKHSQANTSAQESDGPHPEAIVRRPRAARIVGVEPGTMAKWACAGFGPPMIKLGKRAVGYRVRDLLAWLDSRRVVFENEAA